ncbi:hypothetical protein HDU89_008890 [Geranomyces variabilis]|nr:hypothetical protein HDU89_008890 [Geranomyces variabilis]
MAGKELQPLLLQPPSHRRERQFPPELLAVLFAQPALATDRASLSTCALVCSRWYWPAILQLWSHPVFPHIQSFVGFVRQCNRLAARESRSLHDDHINRRVVVPVIGRWGVDNLRALDFTSTPHLSSFALPSHLSLVAGAGPPQLLRLNLSGCQNVDDISVVSLVAAVAQTLQALDLSNCWRITDLAIDAIANVCAPFKRLRSFCLRRLALVSDVALSTVAAFLGPSLVRFDVSHCKRITDVSLLKLVQPPNTSLIELRFADTNVARSAFAVVVSTAFKYHKDLSILEFSAPSPPKGSFDMPNRSFPAHALASRLNQLHIAQANLLSLEHLAIIAEIVCPQLTHLSLCGLSQLFYPMLHKVLSKCSANLVSLCLHNCYSVTDALMLELSGQRFMPGLTHLDISGCRFVRDAGLRALIRVQEASSPKHETSNEGSVCENSPLAPPTSASPPCALPVAKSLRVIKLCGCPRVTWIAILALVHALSPRDDEGNLKFDSGAGKNRGGGALEEIHIDGESLAEQFPGPEVLGQFLNVDPLIAIPEEVGVGEPNASGHRRTRWTEVLKGRQLLMLGTACQVTVS